MTEPENTAPVDDVWEGPLQPPPFWLRPELEVTEHRPPLERDPFIVACVQALLALGLTTEQALGVQANTISEIGWKFKFRAWNLGGVKINKNTCKNPDGSPRRWWRALGHKKSGDPHTCFYRAYDSLEAYFAEWIRVFVPKPPAKGRYGATGARFWAGLEWFPAMVEAGYKGEVTKANPTNSLTAHRALVREVSEYWAQHLLGGLVVDGAWGKKTQARCREWQKEHGLAETGELDEATRRALFTP